MAPEPPHKKHKQRPPPHAIDTHAGAVGLRTIATFEAIKGVFVLAVGFGLLSLMHKDVGEAAEHIVHRLHISPTRHISRIFIEAADKVTDAKLVAIALGALAYSTVRFVEAYGLWNRRIWAEWFALLSGCLYLPWEIFEMADHPTRFRFGLFGINLAVVLYMVWVRWADSRPIEVDEPQPLA
jgi:uncharacterized membrane protein (DUF2068 family)